MSPSGARSILLLEWSDLDVLQVVAKEETKLVRLVVLFLALLIRMCGGRSGVRYNRPRISLQDQKEQRRKRKGDRHTWHDDSARR